MGEQVMGRTSKDPSRVGVYGPLASYAEGFRGELARLGYTPLSAIVHLRLMARVSSWLAGGGLEASALTPQTVEIFFAERRAAGYYNSLTSKSLKPLVDYLRRSGVLAAPSPAGPAAPAEVLLERYRQYLLLEGGLATTTADVNVRMARPFLLERAQACDGRLDLDQLTAGEVSTFVVRQSRERPASVKRMVTALRSLLAFLHVQGITGQAAGTAVPTVTRRKQAGPPQALDRDQVAALLAACDRATPSGCRDYAMVTLMVRLGLRAGDVAALGLDDIDWRRGEITVRGKGNRHDTLPLPADVGQAVAGYLTGGRPSTTADGRTVFVGAQAPHRALTGTAVTCVVARAARRAGLGTVHAHRLRHSAATTMLAAGASLTEIGQALRHASPATTAIYAKVDLEALRTVARPWPGAAA
jgi:integrase/recombinase XerD